MGIADETLTKEIVYRLYIEAKKLRGLASLIESKGETLIEPLDASDRNEGIAMIVEHIADAVWKAANELEEAR